MTNRFHFLTPVWGDEFVSRYVDFFLPAQINNLLPGMIYKIITTESGEREIRSSKAFRALKEIMQVIFLRIPDISCSYTRMSVGYEIGMGGVDDDATFVFLTPDSIWSSGSFNAMRAIIDCGYRAVMIPGPRANIEGFVPEYLARCDKMMRLDSRTMSALFMEHMHRIIKSCMFDQGFHNTHPAALYWKSDRGYVARHFVYHPLAVRPRAPIARIRATIDYDLAPSCVKESDIYLVTDSDEILGIDLAASTYDQGTIEAGDLDVGHVIKWFENGWPTAFHGRLGMSRVFIHADDLGKQYEKHIAASNEVAGHIRRYLYTMRARRALKHFKLRSKIMASSAIRHLVS